MTNRAAGTDKDWERGRRDGEVQALATGETWSDLEMVPNVPGSAMYKTGFRLGYAKVRNDRYKAEVAEEMATRAMNQGYGI